MDISKQIRSPWGLQTAVSVAIIFLFFLHGSPPSSNLQLAFGDGGEPDFDIASETECDPRLSVSSSDPLRYRKRGDRCEGRYLRGMSSGGLGVIPVVGFTWTHPSEDLQSSCLAVRSSYPDTVHLKALSINSLKWSTPYRLDYRPSPSEDTETTRKVFETEWSSRIVNRLGLQTDDLGVLIVAEDEAGDQILLPASLNRRKCDVAGVAEDTKSETIQLVVTPHHRYRSLKITFLDKNQETVKDTLLDHTIYYPRTPVAVELLHASITSARTVQIIGEYRYNGRDRAKMEDYRVLIP
jgi:hypothetical protein